MCTLIIITLSAFVSFSVGAYSNGHNSTMNCQTKLVNSDQFFYLQIVPNGAAKFNRIICMVSCTKKNNVGSIIMWLNLLKSYIHSSLWCFQENCLYKPGYSLASGGTGCLKYGRCLNCLFNLNKHYCYNGLWLLKVLH